MLVRFLLLFLIVASLQAAETPWYSKIDTTVEAGLYRSDFKGTLSNPSSSIDFKDDFKYADTTSSFFSIESRFNFPYVPNIYVTYFNMTQESDVTFNREITFVESKFTNVITSIDYQVLNAVVFQDFISKGQHIPFFYRNFYLGDMEFDVGVNVKTIDYQIKMKDSNSSNTASITYYDNVNSAVLLPYAGFKYSYYDLILFANISTLSFSDVKTTNYQFGADYQIIKNIYLSYGYLYEDFQATERRDRIDFKTVGHKLSIKYAF